MARRFYFSQVFERLDAGAVKLNANTRAFVPLFRTVIAHGAVSGEDARFDPNSSAGWVLCEIDTSEDEHAALRAAPGIVYLPFEDAAGTALSLDHTIADVAPARWTAIVTRLEARGIPVGSLPSEATLSHVVRWIKRRLKIRQRLRSNDFGENLDPLVSSLSGTRRTAISSTLQVVGYDTSVIRGTDTLRQALEKLLAQEIG